MSTARYLKLLTWINGAVPGAMLAWDAARGQLGANSVNDAIRTTGLVALVFLTLSLAVTPLRTWTGWNQLLAVRRPLGLWGFYYACAHLVLYVGWDRALDLGSTVEEIATRRYLQVGLLAVTLMVPLAITSTDRMIQRLGAKRWKKLHRLAYVATAAGSLHYYLLVKSDVRQPLAFAGAIGALLAWRGVRSVREGRRPAAPPRGATKAAAAAVTPQGAIASPSKSDRRPWTGELVVARIFDETPNVRTFRLVPPDGGPLPFTHAPGQFLTLRQQVDGQRVTRCYTIASPPSRSHSCEITVKREPQGVSSGNLHEHVREGDRLSITAPGGKFTFTGAEAQRIVLIAGGVGVTPLMSICRYLTDVGWRGEIDFLFAARTREEVIFRNELTALAERTPNLRVHVILSQADDDPTWQGLRGRLSAEMLRQLVADWSAPLVYLCGPKPMMEGVGQLLEEIGVSAGQLRTEAFGPAAKAPNAAAAPDAEASRAEASVSFARSMKSAIASAQQSVLETAEEAGCDIPFECRSGICGQCKVRLSAGQVKMSCEDALSAAEKKSGLILACQARPLEDLVVEA